MVLVISAVFVACSSIHMKYEGEIHAADGRKGIVQAEKSYKVDRSHREFCMFTGIFFGGYCWFYLVMPTTEQRRTFYEDVVYSVQQETGTSNFELKTKVNDRVSFSSKEDQLRVNFYDNGRLKRTRIGGESSSN